MLKNKELILLILILIVTGKFLIDLSGNVGDIKWLALILLGYIGVRKYGSDNTFMFLVSLGIILASFLLIVFPYLPSN